MASFRSDAQGFLIGDLVETSRDLLRAQQESVRVWKAIHADVRAIARMMGVQVSANNRLNQPGSRGPRGPRPPALPPGRGRTGPGGAPSLGNAGLPGLPGLPSPPGLPGRRSADERATRNSASGSTPARRGANGRFLPGAGNAGPATPAGRGSNGRFTPGQGGAGGEPDGGAETSGAIARLSDTIGGLSGALVSTENVDPTINAMREVSDVVAPLGRGLFSLFGRSSERKKERWYTRILKALTSQGGGGAGAGTADGVRTGSFFGTLMGELVPRAVAFVAPLLMGIATAMMAGLGLLGAAALGTFVGGKIYEWLDKSGIATKIFDAFDAVTGWFKEKYQSTKDGIKTLVQTAKDKVNSAMDSAKKTVSDFKKGAAETSAPVAPGSRQPDGQVSELPPATSMAQRAGRLIGGGKKVLDRWTGGARDDLTSSAVTAGVDPGLVAQIGHFESGFNPNAMPITRSGKKLSSAHGYGQFLDGTWTGVLNKHGAKYGIKDAGKLTNSQAEKYRNDPKIQAAMLAEFTKENVVKGKAAGGTDDAANVYAFHNLGDGDAKRVLSGMKSDPSMTVRDALIGGRKIGEKERSRIESVISGNKSLYGDGSITATQAYKNMGDKMRQGSVYANDARKYAATNFSAGVVAPPSPARIATVSLPSMPAANVPPSVPVTLPAMPDTPPPPVKLNSSAGAGRGTVVVKIPNETGQNIGDRGIAHIVTGGLGAS